VWKIASSVPLPSRGTQAYNLGRLCALVGGLPETTAGMAMERQCSSGLMTIATAAKSIMCNEYDVAVAGGVESISLTQNKYKNSYRNVSKAVLAVDPYCLHPDDRNGRSGLRAL
jgi:acetyl-CoA C-acetyltransferase